MNEDDLPRPPYPVALLADLHAGVLDDAVAERLWSSVRRDADAMAILDRFDDIRLQLRELRVPDVDGAGEGGRIPPEIAARIDTALAARERPAPARVGRWAAVTAGIGVAAACAAVIAFGLRPGGDDTAPQAQPATGGGTHLVDGTLPPDALRAVVGSSGLGPLSDPDRLRECLSANGFAPDSVIVGSQVIRGAGDEVIALLLSGPVPPQLTALVVGTHCSAADPATVQVEVLG